jgi:hypothetical protein
MTVWQGIGLVSDEPSGQSVQDTVQVVHNKQGFSHKQKKNPTHSALYQKQRLSCTKCTTPAQDNDLEPWQEDYLEAAEDT